MTTTTNQTKTTTGILKSKTERKNFVCNAIKNNARQQQWRESIDDKRETLKFAKNTKNKQDTKLAALSPPPTWSEKTWKDDNNKAKHKKKNQQKQQQRQQQQHNNKNNHHNHNNKNNNKNKDNNNTNSPLFQRNNVLMDACLGGSKWWILRRSTLKHLLRVLMRIRPFL